MRQPKYKQDPLYLADIRPYLMTSTIFFVCSLGLYKYIIFCNNSLPNGHRHNLLLVGERSKL